jgi:hypothetical protein
MFSVKVSDNIVEGKTGLNTQFYLILILGVEI